MSFINELKRRNVLRVAAAYVVTAWLVIQVVETILPAFGFGDVAVRIVTIVFGIGLIPSLVFAWAFELTPEGLKKEKDVDRAQSNTPHTGRKLDRMIMVVLALALGYFAFDKFVLNPQREAAMKERKVTEVEQARQEGRTEALVESYGDKSIAVLPFVNMSSDEEQEYFSDGISEELLNLLSKIPELRVTARTSSFSYKGKDVRVSDVARELNVGHVLEGSVRKAGNQLRITAQLIEAHSETHLWSETYDRELENIFAIQDEISAAIVAALKERLDLKVETTPRTAVVANTEAHDAYLRGRYLVVQRTRDSIAGAVREFEKAITLDPDYALAHAELAMAVILMATYGDLSGAEVLARAEPHARMAMEINSSSAEVQAAMGVVAWLKQSPEEALTYLRQAIKINPNYSFAYYVLGTVLDGTLGRYSESFPMFDKARQLDPLSIPSNIDYVSALIDKGRLEEAEQELEKLSTIAPVWYSRLRGLLTSRGGRWANQVLSDLGALMIEPEWDSLRRNLAMEFVIIGLEKEALAISETPPAAALVMLGQYSDAVAAAETESMGLVDGPAFVALIKASAGEYNSARPALEELWQRSGKLVTRQGRFEVSSAAALIAILRDADADADADVDALITAIRDNVRRYRENGMAGTGITGPNYSMYNVEYEEGIADYLAGEFERGIALIAKASENGFFIPLHESYLQSLYDDPGFAPILAGQKARQANERERFLSIVCSDNPYEEVWQPDEGTCEGML